MKKISLLTVLAKWKDPKVSWITFEVRDFQPSNSIWSTFCSFWKWVWIWQSRTFFFKLGLFFDNWLMAWELDGAIHRNASNIVNLKINSIKAKYNYTISTSPLCTFCIFHALALSSFQYRFNCRFHALFRCATLVRCCSWVSIVIYFLSFFVYFVSLILCFANVLC